MHPTPNPTTDLLDILFWSTCPAQAVRKLLDAGADVNAKTDGGTTALVLAAKRGRTDLMIMLADAGADINAHARVNGGGWTALMHTAALVRDPAPTAFLLSRGARVNETGGKEYTPLALAAANGNLEAVRLLIAAGADIGGGAGVMTPLARAAAGGRLEIARLLVGAGADVNARGDGHTALMYAAQAGHDTVALFLASCGADVNATAENGWTALMGAAAGGHVNMARTLIGCGADISRKTTQGDTAATLADTRGYRVLARDLPRLAFEKATEGFRKGTAAEIPVTPPFHPRKRPLSG